MESKHLVVMMTDIKGFTKATSGMGREEVEALLARHEDLLTPVFAEFEGTIVKGLGDAFLVTFESASQAARAGARIQEVLVEHNRTCPPSDQLFVRVALNAGEVNLRGGDVFGEAVNITARVEGVCAAEQVTLTEAVHLLLNPDELATEYLESVELKGIPFPVKLFRVLPEWLDEEHRGIERALSTPKGAGEGSAVGGLPWRPILAGLSLLAIVFLVTLPESHAKRFESLLKEKGESAAYQFLEENPREQWRPGTFEPAVRSLTTALSAKLSRGEEGWEILAELHRNFPGVSGATDDKTLENHLEEALEELRTKGDRAGFRKALAVIRTEKLPEPDPKVRLAWARRDLAAVYEGLFEKVPEDAKAFADRLSQKELAEAEADLKALAPDEPWLFYLEGVRTLILAGSLRSHHEASSRMGSGFRNFGRVLIEDPAFRERPELRIFWRSLLRAYPPKDLERGIWPWTEKVLVEKTGEWIVPHLKEFLQEAPPETHQAFERAANQNLRRNSSRILSKRGIEPEFDEAAWVGYDLAYLALEPKALSESERLEELAQVATRFAFLTPRERKPHEAKLRGILEKGLAADDGTISTRESLTQIARSVGFEDLVQPSRETWRDLHWLFARGGPWDRSFRDDAYHLNFLNTRMQRLEEIQEPYRGKILDEAQAALSNWKGKYPGLVQALEGYLPEKAQE